MAQTPEALRSLPTGFAGTLPSAIVHTVPEFIWRMSVKFIAALAAVRPSRSGA